MIIKNPYLVCNALSSQNVKVDGLMMINNIEQSKIIEIKKKFYQGLEF